MKTIIKKTTWLTGVEHGWGNGYVLIPKGHKLWGTNYDDIDVSVHGGLTYGEEVVENQLPIFDLEPSDTGCWMVGFDTAHLGDNIKNWPESAVRKETQRLAKQLERI